MRHQSFLPEMCKSAVHDSQQPWVDEFRERGYFVFERLFSDAEVQCMREEADRIAEVAIGTSLWLKRRSARVDIGWNRSGDIILRRLQPFLEMSLLYTRLAEDARVVTPLRMIMNGDNPVLMPEKCKLNYKQKIGTLTAEEREQMELRDPADDDQFGAFPVHNDFAYYRSQRCPPTALSSCVLLDDCTEHNVSAIDRLNV